LAGKTPPLGEVWSPSPAAVRNKGRGGAVGVGVFWGRRRAEEGKNPLAKGRVKGRFLPLAGNCSCPGGAGWRERALISRKGKKPHTRGGEPKQKKKGKGKVGIRRALEELIPVREEGFGGKKQAFRTVLHQGYGVAEGGGRLSYSERGDSGRKSSVTLPPWGNSLFCGPAGSRSLLRGVLLSSQTLNERSRDGKNPPREGMSKWKERRGDSSQGEEGGLKTISKIQEKTRKEIMEKRTTSKGDRGKEGGPKRREARS